jgi:Gp5 C-terminal repeat (3 copies)
MPVFSGSTKISRAVSDPGTDDTLPPSGALSWKAITSASAVAGTVGADACLINGDMWQQIVGSMTENYTGTVKTSILQDEIHNITGNRTKSISGNHTETVVGNQNLSVIGAHNAMYLSPKNDVHASPHNRVNASPEAQQEPASKVHILGVEFEHKAQETTITDVALELGGMGVEFSGAKFGGTLLNVDATVFELASILGIAVEPKISEVELKPLHVFLEGGEAKVAAGTAAVSPSVNAVPHIPTAGGH